VSRVTRRRHYLAMFFLNFPINFRVILPTLPSHLNVPGSIFLHLVASGLKDLPLLPYPSLKLSENSFAVLAITRPFLYQEGQIDRLAC